MQSQGWTNEQWYEWARQSWQAEMHYHDARIYREAREARRGEARDAVVRSQASKEKKHFVRDCCSALVILPFALCSLFFGKK